MLRARVWERVPRSSCTRVSTSVWSSPPRALYFCVRLYSTNPQGLYTVCWCSPPRALYFCVLQYGASSNEICAVRTHKGVTQCAGTRPPELCTQRLCARADLYCPSQQGLVLLCTVRVQRALCGASLQRLYTVCWCSPPKALHPVLMCSCGREQMSSCTSTYTYVRYELTNSLCFCAGGCADEGGTVQMSSCTGTCMSVRCESTTALCSFPLRSYCGTKHSRGTNTPACLVRKPAVHKYLTIDAVYVLSSEMYPYLPGAGKARTHWPTVRKN